MRLLGSAAVVTGGSRGLGAALGRELARRGARVVLVARGREEVEAVAAGIRARGGEAHAPAADVGSQDQIYPLAGAAAALVGPIDLLIHDASTLRALPLPALAATQSDGLRPVLDVKLICALP